jgi:hypothetical protein
MCDVGAMLGIPSGPSADETSLEKQSTSMAKTLGSNYSQAFAQQGDVLGQLQGEIGKIETGQTGPGFGAEENAAKISQIGANAAANERNAEQFTANLGAGQNYAGGTDSSGLGRAAALRTQQAGEAVSAGEAEKSAALNQETQQNFAQGRANAAQTVGGLQALSGDYSGRANASLAGQQEENRAATSQTNEITKQMDARAGGIGALAKGALGALVPGAGMLSAGISAFSPNADTGFLDSISNMG